MSPEKPEEPSRKRAAATLGVVADADAFAVRSAFFRNLVSFEFAPPEEWIAAANRLGVTLPLACSASETMADYERADVETFLASYWSLAPEDRKARWEELDGCSRDAGTHAMLSRVRVGLGVAVMQHADAALNGMARFIRELYVLPGNRWGIRRLEWCAEAISNVESLSLRIRLHETDPESAGLDPELLFEKFQEDQTRLPVDWNAKRYTAQLPSGLTITLEMPSLDLPPADRTDDRSDKMRREANRRAQQVLKAILLEHDRKPSRGKNKQPPTNRGRRSLIRQRWFPVVIVVGVAFGFAILLLIPRYPTPREYYKTTATPTGVSKR